MSELKPCPFCNGSASCRMTGSGWFVACSACAGHMATSGWGFDTQEEAVVAWNRRDKHDLDKHPRWTDEDIQGMTVFIEHGDNLEWLGDESAEVVFLADVLRMRDELTAQLAEAQQRMAELEQARTGQWTDERIDRAVADAFVYSDDETRIKLVTSTMERIRNDLAAQLADTKQQIAVQEGAEG